MGVGDTGVGCRRSIDGTLLCHGYGMAYGGDVVSRKRYLRWRCREWYVFGARIRFFVAVFVKLGVGEVVVVGTWAWLLPPGR
jgi:hypothetical protein